MGFAGESQSVYPIVNCDLSDVIGTSGLPAPTLSCARCPNAISRWSGHLRPFEGRGVWAYRAKIIDDTEPATSAPISRPTRSWDCSTHKT